jgi:hypothetical protein
MRDGGSRREAQHQKQQQDEDEDEDEEKEDERGHEEGTEDEGASQLPPLYSFHRPTYSYVADDDDEEEDFGDGDDVEEVEESELEKAVGTFDEAGGGDASGPWTPPPPSHSYVFVAGDLNFRLRMPPQQALREIAHAERLSHRGTAGQEHPWHRLLALDELRASMASSDAFPGFEEARINFPPTYRRTHVPELRLVRVRGDYASLAALQKGYTVQVAKDEKEQKRALRASIGSAGKKGSGSGTGGPGGDASGGGTSKAGGDQDGRQRRGSFLWGRTGTGPRQRVRAVYGVEGKEEEEVSGPIRGNYRSRNEKYGPIKINSDPKMRFAGR